LDGDEQHDEAHLLAVSVLKGVAGIDGAMVELLTVVHRKEERRRGRWRRRDRRRGEALRFLWRWGAALREGRRYGVGWLTMTAVKGKRGICLSP
jgi:hypothetical protein